MILKDIVVVFSCLLLDQCNYHWEKDSNTKVDKPDLFKHTELKYVDNHIKNLKKKTSISKHSKISKRNKKHKTKHRFQVLNDDIFDKIRTERQQRSKLIQRPVKVDVFFESLCPDSRNFIANQLWPTYNNLYNTGIFTFSMYAYGNAESIYNKANKRWEFTCQHGPEECRLNLVESCVVLHYPKPTTYFPFIKCLEEDPNEQQAQACAMKNKMNWNDIIDCTNSKEGNTYQYKVGTKTPDHTFIPWILINDKEGEAINNRALKNLKGLICSTYTGPKPAQCNNMEPTLY